MDVNRLREICLEIIRGQERLGREVPLTPRLRQAWRRSLASHYFWRLGYACYLQHGDSGRAFEAFHRALTLSPTDMQMWRSYAAAALKTVLRPFVKGGRPRPSALG